MMCGGFTGPKASSEIPPEILDQLQKLLIEKGEKLVEVIDF